MGVASKIFSVILRCGELVASIIILGVLGYFLWIISEANIYSDARIVYVTVLASISTFLSIVLVPPFTYSFLAFPIDLIVAVLWLVAFCLLEALTGINTCNSVWYWNYWGFYWGGFWRTPFVVNGPADIGWAGCSSWSAVLAWSFINFILFFCSACLGAYVTVKYREEKRHLPALIEREVKTRQAPPVNPAHSPTRNGEPSTANNV